MEKSKTTHKCAQSEYDLVREAALLADELGFWKFQAGHWKAQWMNVKTAVYYKSSGPTEEDHDEAINSLEHFRQLENRELDIFTEEKMKIANLFISGMADD